MRLSKSRVYMIFVSTFLLFFCLHAGTVSAATPQTMNYQGYLTNTSGVPVNTTVSITFALYDVSTDGTALWTETHGSVAVSNGVFNVVLGNTTPINLAFDVQYWLGVKVGSDAEMTPRRQLTSVGYAFRAGAADSVSNAASIIPAGTVVAFAGTTVPTGWLWCDGTSYLRTTYSTLYAAIGTAHGAADGTHFNVPDYRGRFLRGVDGLAGNDPDNSSRTAMNTGGNTGNAVGSVQDDAFQYHTHYSESWANFGGDGSLNSHNQGYGLSGPYGNTIPTKTVDGRNSSETRPKNAYVNWIIKY